MKSASLLGLALCVLTAGSQLCLLTDVLVEHTIAMSPPVSPAPTSSPVSTAAHYLAGLTTQSLSA